MTEYTSTYVLSYCSTDRQQTESDRDTDRQRIIDCVMSYCIVSHRTVRYIRLHPYPSIYIYIYIESATASWSVRSHTHVYYLMGHTRMCTARPGFYLYLAARVAIPVAAASGPVRNGPTLGTYQTPDACDTYLHVGTYLSNYPCKLAVENCQQSCVVRQYFGVQCEGKTDEVNCMYKRLSNPCRIGPSTYLYSVYIKASEEEERYDE